MRSPHSRLATTIIVGLFVAAACTSTATPAPAATPTTSPASSAPATSTPPSPAPSPTAPAPECPGWELYLVAADDTLTNIARRRGVTVEALQAANPQISDGRTIGIGDEITISPIDLGSLGADWSEAHAVNDRGQVVGSSGHAFLWQDGTMTDLGTLGGDTSGAQDINDRGQVVGWSEVPAGDPAADLRHAFLWQDGTMTDLGTLGGGWSQASAINERGQVVGTSYTAEGDRHAFLWEEGRMFDLGTGGAIVSDAFGINDRGQIVGTAFSDTEMSGHQAILWQDGRMIDLGTLGGDSAEAHGINEHGQVVGWSWTAIGPVHPGELGGCISHAFLWQDGTMTDLGTLAGVDAGSRAEAINDCGSVVGSGSGWLEGGHALLWQGGGQPPGLDEDPLLNTFVVTVSDRLRVRSEPRVSDDSTKYEPLLPLGTELLVLDGPVSASGYTWYKVAPVSFSRLEGPGFGWVAMAGKDGEPWIGPAE